MRLVINGIATKLKIERNAPPNMKKVGSELEPPNPSNPTTGTAHPNVTIKSTKLRANLAGLLDMTYSSGSVFATFGVTSILSKSSEDFFVARLGLAFFAGFETTTVFGLLFLAGLATSSFCIFPAFSSNPISITLHISHSSQ